MWDVLGQDQVAVVAPVFISARGQNKNLEPVVPAIPPAVYLSASLGLRPSDCPGYFPVISVVGRFQCLRTLFGPKNVLTDFQDSRYLPPDRLVFVEPEVLDVSKVSPWAADVDGGLLVDIPCLAASDDDCVHVDLW